MNSWQIMCCPALSEAGVTTNQILTGVGLILALAVGSEVLASRLHIPAIIVLLPAVSLAPALAAQPADPGRSDLPEVERR
jgi:NhaP-type Na+/H+ or K+/H+ antiporter